MIKTLAIIQFLIIVQLSCIGDIPKNQAHRIAESCLVNLAACIVAFHAPVDLPVISNLRDKGIVNTGFMIGTAGSNTSSVEVSLDNGAYTPAVGTTSWKFQFPTGSSTWRDNSQHTISVRTRNSNGNTSPAIAITVRKGTNKDINGDGYEDVAIDGASYNAGQGRVYIFYSTGFGGVTQTLAASANRIITGESGLGYFGFGISTGDINGDGYADLVVGAKQYNSARGRAYIFYSTGSSGITATTASSADKIITGEVGTTGFGIGVATGDINGDGYTDVIIGASAYNTNWGRAYIFYSAGSGGVTQTLAASADKTIDAESSTSILGAYIATGDLNGDGFADLIVSGYGDGFILGRAYIFYSTGAGGVTQTLSASANRIITAQSITDYFSVGLETGDINGDGFPDLILGAQGYNANQGRTYIFYSSGVGGVSQTLATSADRIIAGETGTGNFGFGLIEQDINGDGFKDIITGAPNYNASQGRAYIFYSTGISGVTPTLASSADKIIVGEASSQFGRWRY